MEQARFHRKIRKFSVAIFLPRHCAATNFVNNFFLEQFSDGRCKMVQIDVVYEGKLRCSARHVDSGATLVTDAPKDNMGEGKSFSPTDLVGTALGTCMLTTMAIVGQRNGLDITGTKVTVLKEMTATPPRRIAKLSVEMHVSGKWNDEQKQKLQGAALNCPVFKSLHPDVQIPANFHWE
jgi:putative redox protein